MCACEPFGTNCCLPGTAASGASTSSLDWALGPSVQSYLIIWVFRLLGVLEPFCPVSSPGERPAASDWVASVGEPPLARIFRLLRPFLPLACSRPGDGPPPPRSLRPIRPVQPALKRTAAAERVFFSTPIPPPPHRGSTWATTSSTFRSSSSSSVSSDSAEIFLAPWLLAGVGGSEPGRSPHAGLAQHHLTPWLLAPTTAHRTVSRTRACACSQGLVYAEAVSRCCADRCMPAGAYWCMPRRCEHRCTLLCNTC